MEWLNVANGIVALIGALIGIIGTGIPLFIAIKKLFAEKDAKEVLKLIYKTVEDTIRDVEKKYAAGTIAKADKKSIAMEAIKSALKANDIDADAYVDIIDKYIDDCVKFINDCTK